jgi:hypothetical protein
VETIAKLYNETRSLTATGRALGISVSTVWEALNGRRSSQYRRGYEKSIKRRFGLNPEDVARMELVQDRRCAICRRAGELEIDHCHLTGRVRGLLCRTCNLLLGLIRDDPSRLEEIVPRIRAYLR